MAGSSLDSILQEGLIVDRKWLHDKGFYRPTVDYYLRLGKLKAVARGVYRKPGPPLKWESIVYSLSLLGYHVHVGHKTALSRHGYRHYLSLGSNNKVRLYSDKKLPHWINNVEGKYRFLVMARNPFPGSDIGIEEIPFGTWDWPIKYSMPERAFLELLSTLKKAEEIENAELIMEGASNLRPSQIQSLLEECRQVKAKRLFLWLGREQRHPWFEHIDLTKIDLGKGKRQIVKGGILDEEYLITVPGKNENEPI